MLSDVYEFVTLGGIDYENKYRRIKWWELGFSVEEILPVKCLFYTKMGYIGVVERGAKPGDQVYVVPSCPMPMVFREAAQVNRTECSTRGSKTLRVVSGCYLHGWMDWVRPIPEEALDRVVII